MNDKRNRYGLLLLLSALLLFSCSQEDMPGVAGGADDSEIVFRITLPDDETRTADITKASNLNDGFYASAICPEVEATGSLQTYFEELSVTPLEEKKGYFGIFDQSSELCVWPSIRHRKEGRLKFFAFYPSREELRQHAGVASTPGYFELKNDSKKNGAEVAYDYRMLKFKVNKEITRHIDFVTAVAEGSRRANGETGMKLEFEHQLSRIVLKAYGTPAAYDVEIAGVRIGCAVVESDFNFAGKPTHIAQGDATVSGNWVGTQKKDCVEYIFREGDTVIPIGSGSYTSTDSAASIMGNGGWAMVIPADNTIWNYKTDGKNSTQGLYFSVLLRVKEKDKNKNLLYPYTEGADFNSSTTTDNMNVVYFSVEKATGKVIKRLYRNKEDRKFYTGPDFAEAYAAPESEEVRNYGWAAVPLTGKQRWKPGYQYTYTLNYTEGVGVEDPDDMFPGKPIISKILVGVTENETAAWHTVNKFEKGDEVDVTGDVIIR